MAWSAIYVVLAAVGIDVGWQPLPTGGFEYIIHLEPDALTSLRDGLEIHSQVPPFLRDFRVCRIAVSNQAPPRLGEPEAAAGPELHAGQKPQTPGSPPAGTNPPATPQPNTAPLAIAPNAPELKPLTAQQAGGTQPAGGGSMTFPPPPDAPPTGTTPGSPSGATNPPAGPKLDTASRPPLENPIPDPFGQRHTAPPSASPEKGAGAAPKTEPAAKPAATNPKASEPSWIDPARAPNWLLGTALGLFVSLGGNAYLGWLAWGFRNRYERSIERLKQNLASSSSRSVA